MFMVQKPQFLVQDLPKTKEGAESSIAFEESSDRVTFEAQDFIALQRRKGLFLLSFSVITRAPQMFLQ